MNEKSQQDPALHTDITRLYFAKPAVYFIKGHQTISSIWGQNELIRHFKCKSPEMLLSIFMHILIHIVVLLKSLDHGPGPSCAKGCTNMAQKDIPAQRNLRFL